MANKTKTKGAISEKVGGDPRIPKPAGRPASREAETGSASSGADYSDRSKVGVYDATRAFKNARGNPGPRGPEHEVEGKQDRVQPGDKLESGVPAPID